MKRTLFILLSGILVLSLTACGGSSKEDDALKELSELSKLANELGVDYGDISNDIASTVTNNEDYTLDDINEDTGSYDSYNEETTLGYLPSRFSDFYTANFEEVVNASDDPFLALDLLLVNSLLWAPQFDLLNLYGTNGTHTGQLMFGGGEGTVDKSDNGIDFSYEAIQDENTYGFNQEGDITHMKGYYDFGTRHYTSEETMQRFDETLSCNYTEIKEFENGAFAQVEIIGKLYDSMGDESKNTTLKLVYMEEDVLHFFNGKSSDGIDFEEITFVGADSLTKDQLISLVESAGFTIESSGTITDKVVKD